MDVILLVAGCGVWLKLELDGQLCAELQVFDVGGVLLTRVVQLTALTERLEMHRQRCCLHMHRLIVRDGALDREEEGASNTQSQNLSVQLNQA